MKINGRGYLSDEALVKSDLHCKQNSEIISIFDDSINALLDFLDLHNDVDQSTDLGAQQLIMLVLLARLIEISQSAYLQFKHGMSNELRSSTRVFLDAYFIIANVGSNYDFISEYFKTDLAQRIKLMNVASQYDDDLFNPANEYASKDVMENLKALIENEKAKELKSYSNALNVGCGKLYDSIYRLTSAAIHSSPRSLMKYIEEDANGNVDTINIQPDNENVFNLFYEINYRLILILQRLPTQ